MAAGKGARENGRCVDVTSSERWGNKDDKGNTWKFTDLSTSAGRRSYQDRDRPGPDRRMDDLYGGNLVDAGTNRASAGTEAEGGFPESDREDDALIH